MFKTGVSELTCEWHELNKADGKRLVFCHFHELKNFCVINAFHDHNI